MPQGTKQKLRNIIDVLLQADTFKTFQKPVRKAMAPDYYDIVKKPMHLKTVKAKLEKGDYDSELDFERVRLRATTASGPGFFATERQRFQGQLAAGELVVHRRCVVPPQALARSDDC